MSEQEKGDGVAPQQTDGVENVEQGQNAGGINDSVKYETYRRTLSEAKKYKSEVAEIRSELQQLREANFAAEGKKDELLSTVTAERDKLKTQLAEAHGAFARGRAMDVIVDEAVKQGVASTSLLKKAIGDRITELDFDDEYRPNVEQVQMILEDVKRQEPLLFQGPTPKVANHKLNPQAGQVPDKPVSEMTKEELVEAMKR